jgi:hypothetical protein
LADAHACQAASKGKRERADSEEEDSELEAQPLALVTKQRARRTPPAKRAIVRDEATSDEEEDVNPASSAGPEQEEQDLEASVFEQSKAKPRARSQTGKASPAKRGSPAAAKRGSPLARAASQRSQRAAPKRASSAARRAVEEEDAISQDSDQDEVIGFRVRLRG